MRKAFLFAFIATAAITLVSFTTISYAPSANQLQSSVKEKTGAIPFKSSSTETYTDLFYNDCSGEWVELTGTVTYDTHGVINGNKMSSVLHISEKDKGVGLTSGKQYTGSIERNDAYNVSFNGAVIFSIVENGVLATPGGGNNIKVRAEIKVTINANGDVTVERGSPWASIECQ
jgi:hypothetical protein